MTPIDIPPSRALPHTTDFPHSAMVSVHEPLSKKPPTQDPSSTDSIPAIICRGSYGVFVGLNSIFRSTGSADGSGGDREKQLHGT